MEQPFISDDGAESKSIIILANVLTDSPPTNIDTAKESIIDRREAVAESRDSLISQPVCANMDPPAPAAEKNITKMYSVMADFIEQITSQNMKMAIEMKELHIKMGEMELKINSLIDEKQAIEKTNTDLQKKIIDLRATVITTMTREIESLRREMETQRHDVQKKAMEEVRSHLESLPTVETKFQDMLREQRSVLARSLRKTARSSLPDADFLTGFVEEHILPLQQEINTLKAKLQSAAE